MTLIIKVVYKGVRLVSYVLAALSLFCLPSCFDCLSVDCKIGTKQVNFHFIDEHGSLIDYRDLGISESAFDIYNISSVGDTSKSLDSYVDLYFVSVLYLDENFENYLMVIADTLEYSIEVVAEVQRSECCGDVTINKNIALNGSLICNSNELCTSSILNIVIPQ